MAKQPKELTRKVRELLDENPDLTAKTAEPKVRKIAERHGLEMPKDFSRDFGAMKYQWKQRKESGQSTTSKKPETSGKSGEVPSARRGRPPKTETTGSRQTSGDTQEMWDAFQFVESQGGVHAVHRKIQEHETTIKTLQNEIDDMEKNLDLVEQLKERVTKTAA